MPSVAELLGFAVDDRVLIVTCADLGLCHASTVGVFDALRAGSATSATLTVPAPWARESASRFRGEDVGVAFSLNSQMDRYRWGPLTHAPSLLDGDGGFPRTVADLWDHADVDEVRRECRAQLERAVLWGFDITHLDTALDALLLRPEFFDVYLELATEFGLPVRTVDPASEVDTGFPVRQLAADEGVLSPDHLRQLPGRPTPADLEALLEALPSGVTEITLHPAVDTPELRALTDDWAVHVAHHRLLTADDGLRRAVDAAGVHLTGYRALRRAMTTED